MFITACSNDGYRIENGQVVYERPWNEGLGTVIEELNADPKTFKVLGKDNVSWAKDAYTVFWGYIPLKFMDAKTFEVLGGDFAKDKDKVICGRDIINEADIGTFSTVELVNIEGKKRVYGVDEFAVYTCGLRIPTKDIENFKPLKDGFFKDSRNVSWLGYFLQNANANKFKVLNGGYGTDGSNVYYHHKKIFGADPESFEVISFASAKDKNYKYKFEDRVRED